MNRKWAGASVASSWILGIAMLCLADGVIRSDIAFAQTLPNFQPQNIIVILSDDVQMNDLPFFGTELSYWDDESQPNQPTTANHQPSVPEAAVTHLGTGKLEARLYAETNGKLGRLSPGSPRIVPVDLDGPNGTVNTTAHQFTYDSQNCADPNQLVKDISGCNPHRDILANHGGLRRIGLTSARVFRRFYSAAATCGPSRGALLTGRHPKRLGADEFQADVPPDEVTIAEFLKQGCDDDSERLCVDWSSETGAFKAKCDCFMGAGSSLCSAIQGGGASGATCYTTGVIGKWHVGKGPKSPMAQGFDEYIGLKFGDGLVKPSRHAPKKLTCSPDTNRYCSSPSTAADRLCTKHSDCGTPAESPHCPTRAEATGIPGFALTTPVGLYLGADRDLGAWCNEGNAREDSFCCEPRRSPNIRSMLRVGQKYSTSKKQLGAPTEEGGFAEEKENKRICNDDGPVDATGCPYFDRVIRDRAADFIRRHSGEPFFLYVPLTLLHSPQDATDRVLAHYRENPNSGVSTEEQRFAMSEELDATIGGIVDAVYGAGLQDRTTILYTSDNGHERHFGSPNFARGKGTISEAGTRMGLIVHMPGQTLGAQPLLTTSTSAATQLDLDGQLASEVDLFPTIAHLARYDLVGAFDADWRLLPLHSNKETSAGCVPDSINCVERGTDGQSLLPAIFDPAANRHREGVFVREPEDHENVDGVIVRAGFVDELNDANCTTTGTPHCDFAKGVCGYDSVKTDKFCASQSDKPGITCASNNDCALVLPATADYDVCETRTVRRIRGASATVCDPDAASADATCSGTSIRCSMTQGLCMTPAQRTDCQSDANATTPSCVPTAFTRCIKDTDCSGTDVKCQLGVELLCNGCYAASWRLERDGRLRDMTTNVEEALGKSTYAGDRGFDLDLSKSATQSAGGAPDSCPVLDLQNCAGGTPPLVNASATPTAGQSLCNVKRKLACLLKEWQDCTDIPNYDKRCDEKLLSN